MSENKGLSPVILEIASLSAAVASRCPSTTAEMIGKLGKRGVPDPQIREIVAIARGVATESWSRANTMIDAVLASEPLESCLSRTDTGSGQCDANTGNDCCSESTEKTTCC